MPSVVHISLPKQGKRLWGGEGAWEVSQNSTMEMLLRKEMENARRFRKENY